jgi:hypothetical protein
VAGSARSSLSLVGEMSAADDLRVARERVVAALYKVAPAEELVTAIEALMDAKLRTLRTTYVNPRTGVKQEIWAKGE